MSDLLVDALSLAGVYAFLALGWVLVFRATHVLNFATAELFVLGGFVYAELSSVRGWHWLPAMVATVAALGILGALIYRVLLKRLAGSGMFAQTIVTLGVSIVLLAFIGVYWGAQGLTTSKPFENSLVTIFGASTSVFDLVTVAFATMIVMVLMAFFRWHPIGLQMRAASENLLLASQSAVNVARTSTLAWALSGAVLGLGGVLYSLTHTADRAHATLGLRGLAPALIGGLDSLVGAALGSVLVALIEIGAVRWLGGGIEEVIAFLVLLVILVFRGGSLLGSREQSRS